MKRIRVFWMFIFTVMLYFACATANRDLAIFTTLWLMILDSEEKEDND